MNKDKRFFWAKHVYMWCDGGLSLCESWKIIMKMNKRQRRRRPTTAVSRNIIQCSTQKKVANWILRAMLGVCFFGPILDIQVILDRMGNFWPRWPKSLASQHSPWNSDRNFFGSPFIRWKPCESLKIQMNRRQRRRSNEGWPLDKDSREHLPYCHGSCPTITLKAFVCCSPRGLAANTDVIIWLPCCNSGLGCLSSQICFEYWLFCLDHWG